MEDIESNRVENEYVIYKRQPLDYEPDYNVEVFRDEDRIKALSALEQLVAGPPEKTYMGLDIYYTLEIEKKKDKS